MDQRERTVLQNLENEIKELVSIHRDEYCIERCESEDIEEFGSNEYTGGKLHAFEEALELIQNAFKNLGISAKTL